MTALQIIKETRTSVYDGKEPTGKFLIIKKGVILQGNFNCKEKVIIELKHRVLHIHIKDVICKPEKSIFKFKCYRKFLSCYKKQLKSFRALGTFMGMQTNSFLIEVLQGKKSLGVAATHILATKMGLSFKEHSYFVALVSLKDSKTKEARAFYKELVRKLNPQ